MAGFSNCLLPQKQNFYLFFIHPSLAPAMGIKSTAKYMLGKTLATTSVLETKIKYISLALVTTGGAPPKSGDVRFRQTRTVHWGHLG